MKKFIKYSLTITMVLTLTSCFEQPATVPSTTTGDGGISGGTNGTNGNGTNGTNGSTTSGSTTSGNCENCWAPYGWEVEYAGGVSWHPRNNVNGDIRYDNNGPYILAERCNKPGQTIYSAAECRSANTAIMAETTPNIDDASVAFQSDINRFKVRITVHEKPEPPSGYDGVSDLRESIYCYLRKRGKAQQPSIDDYTSLKFRVALRPFINCGPDNITGCSLGSPVYTTNVQTVAVNSSLILDFTNKRPASDSSYFIEVRDVKNHNGVSIRTSSCWGMRVEVSTSFTRDF